MNIYHQDRKNMKEACDEAGVELVAYNAKLGYECEDDGPIPILKIVFKHKDKLMETGWEYGFHKNDILKCIR
jgi:hypothetical protein